MQPLSWQTTISGLVWVFCGIVVIAAVAAKIGFIARSSPVYWEYVGSAMILFGIVRLSLGLLRGSKRTKPGFWSRFV